MLSTLVSYVMSSTLIPYIGSFLSVLFADIWYFQKETGTYCKKTVKTPTHYPSFALPTDKDKTFIQTSPDAQHTSVQTEAMQHCPILPSIIYQSENKQKPRDKQSTMNTAAVEIRHNESLQNEDLGTQCTLYSEQNSSIK